MTTRERIDEAISHAGEVPRNAATKWNLLYEVFADELGVETGVIGKLLTEERQLSTRRLETQRSNPRYVIWSMVKGGQEKVRLSAVKRWLAEAQLPAARCALIVEWDLVTHAVTPIELQVYHADTVVQKLADIYGALTPVAVTRKESSFNQKPGTSGIAGGSVKPMALVPMVIDDRIRRAIRFSILTTSAVLLVGPPGTGKTTLLMEVIDQIRADPAGFGFEQAILDPMTVTPEESWTARDLIGGMTIAEDNALRFREGYALRAIREDRWLVMDEANRADLDKIFGALLTWLSDQEVDLGPASTEAESPSVRLGWSPSAASKVETIHESYENEDGQVEEFEVPVRYLAGREWRLLGTYNALDAQRVFRFGQALGRRFLRVPVPPIPPDLFVVAAEPLLVKLPVSAREAVASLYAAHFDAEVTQLGPALFMRIPDYILAGLDAVLATVAVEGSAPSPADGVYVNELIAEAYLVNVGAFLARYDEESLEHLGKRIVTNDAMPEAEWQWVLDLSRHLG